MKFVSIGSDGADSKPTVLQKIAFARIVSGFGNGTRRISKSWSTRVTIFCLFFPKTKNKNNSVFYIPCISIKIKSHIPLLLRNNIQIVCFMMDIVRAIRSGIVENCLTSLALYYARLRYRVLFRFRVMINQVFLKIGNSFIKVIAVLPSSVPIPQSFFYL